MIVKDIEEMTRDICNEIDQHTITYEVDQAEEEGHFAKQLVDYSVKKQAHLILIMTNAVQEKPEFILGPWDENIIFNKAQIPVMCINPPKIIVK
jgi:hypothetical protein